MPQKQLTVEFDAGYYRAKYRDLARFTDRQLQEHWTAFGISEGRQASAGAVREALVAEAVKYSPILEIGPFCQPCVTGKDVFYFDVLDQKQLNERAQRIGYSNITTPHIHYVSPIGDLSIVDRKFRAVISSHCIEHQPCLIHHLEQVAALLDVDGRYFLLIPDKRYCFDHFIAVSSIAEVLQAHKDARKVHTLASVIEHRALTTHNDPARHWKGDHADPGFNDSQAERTKLAIIEYEGSNGEYIDVHA